MKNASQTLLLIGGMLLPGLAAAAIVGVDISGGAYTGPGVLDTTSHEWMSKTSNGSTFTLDSQTVTIGLTGWTDGGANADIDLFDHYKHNGGNTTATLSLTGLDLAKTYDIVIFSTQNAFGGRGGRFELMTGSFTGDNPQEATGDQHSTFAEGVNYVRFDGITPAEGGVISFNATNSADGIAVMNGFEIASIPEPGAALLGGIGLVALLRRRR